MEKEEVEQGQNQELAEQNQQPAEQKGLLQKLKFFSISKILIIVIIALVIGIVLLWGIFSGEKAEETEKQTGEILPIAPLPKNGGYTIGEIISKGASEGPDFCDTLEREDLKKTCMESYLSNKAEQEQDASICEESDSPVFVRQCQYNAIMPAVAKKYNEESQDQDNEDIIPSNIDLCEQLDNEEDKAKCYNPKQTIEDDYHLLE